MLGGSAKKKPVVRSRKEHGLSRRDIDPDAVKVLYRLHRSGYIAYLVGGGVRDLLLGVQPKDFDISTDAHPNQVKKLFHNCFLIGRRFRLAHIRFRGKIIETSTFRRQPDETVGDETGHPTILHRDNTFGTPEEDARRRDFTINALFYDISDFSVIDHVGGLDDLNRKVVRCIGDPNVRFLEDPVRMLRAVRFAARLGFRIERRSLRAIHKHRKEILKAPPSRLLEDIYKLFAFRSAEASFRLLQTTGLLKPLFPEVDLYLKRNGGRRCILWRYLQTLDADETFDGAPPPALMLGALYAPLFFHHIEESGVHANLSLYNQTAQGTLADVASRMQVPKKVLYSVTHMLAAQSRFQPDVRKFSRPKFMRQEDFPLALALFSIRTAVLKLDPKPVEEWKSRYGQFLKDEPQTRQRGPRAGEEREEREERPRRRRPRRRRRRPETSG